MEGVVGVGVGWVGRLRSSGGRVEGLFVSAVGGGRLFMVSCFLGLVVGT